MFTTQILHVGTTPSTSSASPSQSRTPSAGKSSSASARQRDVASRRCHSTTYRDGAKFDVKYCMNMAPTLSGIESIWEVVYTVQCGEGGSVVGVLMYQIWKYRLGFLMRYVIVWCNSESRCNYSVTVLYYFLIVCKPKTCAYELKIFN